MAGAKLELDDESFAMRLHVPRDRKASHGVLVLRLLTGIRPTPLRVDSAAPRGGRSTVTLSPK